ATVCTRSRPACDRCPVADSCIARRDGRVAELPAPRPRKSLETRAVRMLVFRRGGEVLLERRPPSGVWGGLWSLPEMPDEDAPGLDSSTQIAARAADLGLRVSAVEPLSAFVHVFTHFRLRVTPILVEVTTTGMTAESSPIVWLPMCDADGAALPTPVKGLLVSLAPGRPEVSGQVGVEDGLRRARGGRAGPSAP
ncbi:MAG: A/G-specific adenine glycosylase, partial [Pseudomonadota bacterium]